MDFTAWKCSLSGERVFSESCGSFSFAFDWRKVLCSFFPFSHPLQYYFFFSWWFSIFVSVCCTLKTHQNKSFCAEVYPLKLLLNFTVLNEFPWIWICRCVTQRETIWRSCGGGPLRATREPPGIPHTTALQQFSTAASDIPTGGGKQFEGHQPKTWLDL